MSIVNQRRALTLIELLVVIAIIAVLTALLLPAVQQAREAARRTACRNHLKQIGLALHNYESTHGLFPPGILGTTGSPTTSQPHTTWLAQILPYLEQAPLYGVYDFHRPFNHAANAEAVAARLPVFLCPSQPNDGLIDQRYGPGHYAGSAGTIPGGDDGLLFPMSSVRIRDVRDGTSNTFAAGELAFEILGWGRGVAGGGGGGGGGSGGGGGQGFGRGVLRWWKAAAGCAQAGINPPDTTCSNSVERRFQFSSIHPGGSHFALGDGSVRFISENLDVTLLRALTTRTGGEVIGEY